VVGRAKPTGSAGHAGTTAGAEPTMAPGPLNEVTPPAPVGVFETFRVLQSTGLFRSCSGRFGDRL
jgi:hypothetical protein